MKVKENYNAELMRRKWKQYPYRTNIKRAQCLSCMTSYFISFYMFEGHGKGLFGFILELFNSSLYENLTEERSHKRGRFTYSSFFFLFFLVALHLSSVPSFLVVIYLGKKPSLRILNRNTNEKKK